MNATSLALWGGGATRGVRQRHEDGASVVAWSEADTAALAEAGLPFRSLAEVIGADGMAGADAAARGWARVWARLPLSEGRSFREMVEWRGESLLWAVEGFLRSATAGPRCARSAELCLRLIEVLRPSEVDAFGVPMPDAVLLSRACTACGVLFHGRPGPVRALATAPRTQRFGAWGRLLAGRRRPRGPSLGLAGGERSALSLVLVLFARGEDREALAPLVEALSADAWMRSALVSLSELTAFESSRSRRAAAEAERLMRDTLLRLRGTPAVAASYVHRGVGFADLAAGDLETLLADRLPKAVQRLECAFELLTAAQPALVLLVVPEADERRALGMASAVAGIPWAVLRVGQGHQEEPTRADGGPHPATSITLGPGESAAAIVPRLREVACGTVSPP